MEIKCPKCDEALELPEEAVGAKVQCPFCGMIFTGFVAHHDVVETEDNIRDVTSEDAISGNALTLDNMTIKRYKEVITSTAKLMLVREIQFAEIKRGTVYMSFVLTPEGLYDVSSKRLHDYSMQLCASMDTHHVQVTSSNIRVPCHDGDRLTFWELISTQEEKIFPAWGESVESQLVFWERCMKCPLGEERNMVLCHPYSVDDCHGLCGGGGFQMVLGDVGSGKTMCLNAAICSLALFRQSSSVRFITIDPAGSLPDYSLLPHSIGSAVGLDECIKMLRWICGEIDRRHEIVCEKVLYNVDVEANIRLLNVGAASMPFIAVFIDDFEDILATKDKEVFDMLEKISVSWHEGVYVMATCNSWNHSTLKCPKGVRRRFQGVDLLVMRISDRKDFVILPTDIKDNAHTLVLPGEIAAADGRRRHMCEAVYLTPNDINDVIRIACSGDNKEYEYRKRVRIAKNVRDNNAFVDNNL